MATVTKAATSIGIESRFLTTNRDDRTRRSPQNTFRAASGEIGATTWTMINSTLSIARTLLRGSGISRSVRQIGCDHDPFETTHATS